jgi:hypothetical protein
MLPIPEKDTKKSVKSPPLCPRMTSEDAAPNTNRRSSGRFVGTVIVKTRRRKQVSLNVKLNYRSKLFRAASPNILANDAATGNLQ